MYTIYAWTNSHQFLQL